MNTGYTIQEITQAVQGRLILNAPEHVRAAFLLTDSRRIVSPSLSLFFALKGDRYDGHQFIADLYQSGIRNFIVSKDDPAYGGYKANFIYVPNVLKALQDIAVFHRSKFAVPVIGVTGSNGKTIVKEWIYQLLRDDKNIVRSPKSYNSQIGVPLSVWQMSSEHELGVFEGGLSRPGEMEHVERVMRPSIGIFTNIGHAHDENFESPAQKVSEKMKLFSHAGLLIYCKDYTLIHEQVQNLAADRPAAQYFTWSRKGKADLQIARVTQGEGETIIQGISGNDFRDIRIPFTDEASVENAIHCWSLMIHLGYDHETIVKRMLQLSPVAMRLEMKQGINNCSVINDSYNSDVGSLTIALDFMNQQKQHDKKTLILSDILQSGKNEEALYAGVANLVLEKKVARLIGIGEALSRQEGLFSIPEKIFFKTTEEFLKNFQPSHFRDEIILVKGARAFGFERISNQLQQKGHETILEVNLNALVNNLNYYRSRLKPETKIMAMVKAFSYGSGSFEIATILQFHHVDYLTVAYADEGVELRKGGITLPIMVMNPEEQGFDTMIRYSLEPEIYNFRLLSLFTEAVKNKSLPDHEGFPVHVKLDTGMHRLGFDEKEIPELIVRIKNSRNIKIRSVFSHLVASDESQHDEFTVQQVERFKKMSDQITGQFDYPILKHILNSAGVLRFQEAQFNMVRLGIGLYGIAPTAHEQKLLQNVVTLKTTISQVKNVPSGESIGYSRKGVTGRSSVIATVAVGYADGLDRRLGNGVGKMIVNGRQAPIIGNVCMDMTMIDITDIPAKEGDEVIVFGQGYPVTDFAKDMGTIPYEVLTNISQRVKRVYFHE